MSSEPVLKRGYVKWEDDNGVRHKVPLVEYNAMAELEGKPTLEGESAPARGTPMQPDEVVPNVAGEEIPLDQTPVELPVDGENVGNNGDNTETDVQEDWGNISGDR